MRWALFKLYWNGYRLYKLKFDYLRNRRLQNVCPFCNNCFIIHSKYFPVLKGVLPFRSLFFCSTKMTQSCPQVFWVNGSIICSRLHFWCHFDVIGSIICSVLHIWCHWFNTCMTKILSKFGQRQLVMVNYACSFETGNYFEWIINMGYWPSVRSRWLDICQVLYLCVFMDWDGVYTIHKLAKTKNKTRPISSHLDQTSLVNLLYGFQGNFSCPKQWVVLIEQESSILPARAANDSAGFGSFCLLTGLAM